MSSFLNQSKNRDTTSNRHRVSNSNRQPSLMRSVSALQIFWGGSCRLWTKLCAKFNNSCLGSSRNVPAIQLLPAFLAQSKMKRTLSLARSTCQMLHTSRGLQRLFNTARRISDMFKNVSTYQNCSFTNINAWFYVQLLVSKRDTLTHGNLVLRPLSTFEILVHFHSVFFFEILRRNKKVKCSSPSKLKCDLLLQRSWWALHRRLSRKLVTLAAGTAAPSHIYFINDISAGSVFFDIVLLAFLWQLRISKFALITVRSIQ